MCKIVIQIMFQSPSNYLPNRRFTMAESKGIDWSLRLAELIQASSEIPTDVTFRIEEDTNEENNVKAHRLVMAMASEPFRNMLFVTNTEDKEAKEISVKETTLAAFRAMVDAIYNTKTINESLKEKTVHEMFAVLYLVKKYRIPELVLSARDCLATFPLSQDVVLEVAGDAMKYLTTFDEEAKELLLRCAKFLKPKFKDVKTVFEFITVNKELGDIMIELFVLMNSIKPEQCDNCKQVPCKDGQGANEDEFYAGLKVACNNTSDYWQGFNIGNIATVDSIRQNMMTDCLDVMMKDCQFVESNLHPRPGKEYHVKWNKDILHFCFYCEPV